MSFDIDELKIKVKTALGMSGGIEARAENRTKSASSSSNPLNKILGKLTYDKESVIGVDITPHYIRICQVKKSFDQWMLTNLASACMETQFRNTDIMMNQEAYVENLKDLISKNNIKEKNVSFSVPTSSSIVKVLTFTDMDDDDFHQAAALGSIWESAVMLEGGASEYSIFYKILRHNPAPEVQPEPIAAPVAEAPAEPVAEAPVEEIPTEPVAEATVEEMPAEPVAETPVEEIPTEPVAEATVEEMPAEPVAEAPVEEMPAEPIAEAPVEEMPAEPIAEAPAEEMPAEPVAEAPVEEMPAEPVAEAPVEEMPTEAVAEAPVEEMPAEPVAEAPVEEMPAEPVAEAPVEEMPAEPVAEAPVEEMPAEPVAEAPVEEMPAEPVAEAPVDENNEGEENNSDPNTIAENEGVPSEEMSATISEEVDAIPVETEITEDISYDPAATEGIDNTFEETPMEPEIQGPTMDVLFIATKLTDVNMHADIIKRAGLKPVLADVRCLALKHAFESNPKNLETVREPYAFMEFGPDENYVFVIDGDNTDIYPIYMNDEDINTIIYSSEDANLMQTFVQNYSAQALQILQDHQTNNKTDAIIHIFATSSAPLHVNDASSVPLMKTFVREINPLMPGRQVTECDFCSHIKVPEQFAKKVNAEGNISAWVPTVGIATRKLDLFDVEESEGTAPINRANLLPSYLKDKKDKILNILCTVAGSSAFLIAMLIVGLTYIAINNYGKDLANEIISMGQVEGIYNSKVEKAQQLTILMNQVNSLDDIQQSIPSNQTSILHAYKHITSSIPEGIWLKKITYTLPNAILIEGMSPNDHNILTFIKKLNSKENFMKISLKTMKTEKKKDTAIMPGVNSNISLKKFFLEGTVSGHIASDLNKILEGRAN